MELDFKSWGMPGVQSSLFSGLKLILRLTMSPRTQSCEVSLECSQAYLVDLSLTGVLEDRI